MTRERIPKTLLNSRPPSCKRLPVLSWIAGLLLGAAAAVGTGSFSSLMMRGVEISAVSIPGLLLITSLPFLLTAIAVLFSQPWLLVSVIFLKGALFGYCACGITLIYGSAAWLARLLLMFSDLALLPLLMLLWLRCFGPDRRGRTGLLASAGFAAVLVGLLDFYVVSPFTASLF